MEGREHENEAGVMCVRCEAFALCACLRGGPSRFLWAAGGPCRLLTMLSRAGSRRESGVIGIEDYEDAPTKRGYTTRHKEQQQQLRPTFTGRVRRWEKRWAKQGHLTVWRWERVEGDAADANPDASTGSEEPLRKRARVEQQARRNKLDDGQ